MVYLDQLVAPNAVTPVPPGLVPRVGCDGHLSDSPLGVWRYVECLADFTSACGAALAVDEVVVELIQQGTLVGGVTEVRGRRNINLPGCRRESECECESEQEAEKKTEEEATRYVHALQVETDKAAAKVSHMMEDWLELPAGSLQQAHEKGAFTTLRLLDYKNGAATPPHTDASAYTLIWTTASLMVQDPNNDSNWYALEPCGPHDCLLMLGSHLEEQIAARLKDMGRQLENENIRAPVHRAAACEGVARKAVTVHIKADTTWPTLAASTASNSNTSITSITSNTSTLEIQKYDIYWDAELFSRYMHAKYVPSLNDVRAHWNLLAAVVEGCAPNDISASAGVAYRLPDVFATGYWQLQTMRYLYFLQIHKDYPEETKGMMPPRQIHHVWLCHQLHPAAYKADCADLLGGRLLDHNNSEFCLQGCPRFHELWKRLTGFDWPSEALLYNEVVHAQILPQIPKAELSQCLRANLWHNYDGLTKLYDEVQEEAPSLMSQSSSQLEDTLLDYARFIIAASYAATCLERDLTVTPSGPVDLVWHVHQTSPVAYQQAILELPEAVDHMPCGALNPPPTDGKWIGMTDEVWTELYGYGVDVQGHTIHCCTPSLPRPRGLVASDVQDNVTSPAMTWWFERNVVSSQLGLLAEFSAEGGLALGVSDFPNDLATAQKIADKFCPSTCTPLSIQLLLASMKAELGKMDSMYIHPCIHALDILITVATVPCCLPCICLSLHPEKFQERRQRYEDLVSKFSSEFEEHGISLSMVWQAIGPWDPQKRNHDPYKGDAIVFRPMLKRDVQSLVGLNNGVITEDGERTIDRTDASSS